MVILWHTIISYYMPSTVIGQRNTLRLPITACYQPPSSHLSKSRYIFLSGLSPPSCRGISTRLLSTDDQSNSADVSLSSSPCILFPPFNEECRAGISLSSHPSDRLKPSQASQSNKSPRIAFPHPSPTKRGVTNEIRRGTETHRADQQQTCPFSSGIRIR